MHFVIVLLAFVIRKSKRKITKRNPLLIPKTVHSHEIINIISPLSIVTSLTLQKIPEKLRLVASSERIGVKVKLLLP